MIASSARLGPLVLGALLAAASAEAREIDLGPVRLRPPPGARVELAFRDVLGAPLPFTGPRPGRAVSVRVGFERGTRICGTAVHCGDARATRSVSWPPALPFLFAIEAGPPLLPTVRPGRRRGPGEFARARRFPGVWVSNPARIPLSGGRRATVRCTGTCVVTLPLGPATRAWFVAEEPAEAGAQLLALDAFARDALRPVPGARVHW